jgi:hypothetical protein
LKIIVLAKLTLAGKHDVFWIEIRHFRKAWLNQLHLFDVKCERSLPVT